MGEPRPLGVEQSNVSIAYGDRIILKLYRRLRVGEQPDVEVARFLTEVAQFRNTPAFLGAIEHRPTEGEPTTLAAAFSFVPNQGDAWAVVTDALLRDLEEYALRPEISEGAETAPAPEFGYLLSLGGLLGQRTAELHLALATPSEDPDFAVEELRPDTVKAWADDAEAEAIHMLERLRTAREKLPESTQQLADGVLSLKQQLLDRLRAVTVSSPSGTMTRIHGDYHLGQVLVAQGDVMIIDFEGEPKRNLAERRAKSSPLRDVAGMLRSFDYAAAAALNRRQAAIGAASEETRARAEAWRRSVSADFLAAYREHIGAEGASPEAEAFTQALTDLLVLQKAIYEIGYELSNRPDWVDIPLRGVRDLLSNESAT